MEREVTIADLASKFLAQRKRTAQRQVTAWSWSLRPSDPSRDPGECARFEVVERSKKAHR